MQAIAAAADRGAAALCADHKPAEPDGPTREFLVFRLASEEYGVDIRHVQELREYGNVTHIANAPPFIKGIINLRGSIVPIIDLRMKFDIGVPACDQFTVVVILDLGGHIIGMLVDSVVDVVRLHAGDIQPAPEIAGAQDTRHLSGIGTPQGRMLILLDIPRLMASSDIGLIAAPCA